MQKIFEYIGLISLICFSFFITERTSLIVKEVDDIMIQIKDNYKKYETISLDATIFGEKIVPGICGRKVDINSTYKAMKEVGFYDENLYKFTYTSPKISLKDNYDKLIISGNPGKKYFYIFFELDNDNKEYLNKYEFKNFNIIIAPNFYNQHKDIIKNLIKKNNAILITNTNYLLYKQVSKSYFTITGKKIYCYSNNNNDMFNEVCSSNKSNIILELDTIDSNHLLKTKLSLKNGKFIKLELNNEFIENIQLIENYVDSKGMIRTTIDQTLKEC